MIVSKKYDFFDNIELKDLTTSGTESPVRDLGGGGSAFGGKPIIGAEQAIQLGGLKMLLKGSHGITGTGTITIEVYTGETGSGEAATKIDTLGPYTASDIGGVKQLNFQDYLVQGTVKLKAIASAASAFTAGTLYIGLTTAL